MYALQVNQNASYISQIIKLVKPNLSTFVTYALYNTFSQRKNFDIHSSLHLSSYRCTCYLLYLVYHLLKHKFKYKYRHYTSNFSVQ